MRLCCQHDVNGSVLCGRWHPPQILEGAYERLGRVHVLTSLLSAFLSCDPHVSAIALLRRTAWPVGEDSWATDNVYKAEWLPRTDLRA